MNNEKSKVINLYVSDVIKALKCSKSMASVFRKKFADEINQFSEEHEGLTYETLCERFGTPEEIANGFIDRADYEKLLKSAKRKTTFWRWTAIGCAALVTASIVILIITINKIGGHTTILKPVLTEGFVTLPLFI